MTTLSSLRAAFSIANVKAFYAVVREKESGNGPDAYTLVNLEAPDDPARGVRNHHFSSFANHPYAGLSTLAPDPAKRGYAAGAPQFIPSTWADVVNQYGLTDFSPPNQDLGYVARLVYRGALEDVIAGRFESAVAKCRLEWSSLPGASESRGDWTMDKAKAVFLKYAGGIADGERAPRTDAAPQPVEGHKMGAIAVPLLTSLIPQVLGLFTARAQATIAEKTGADPALAQQFMQGLIQKVGEAVGVPVADDKTAIAAVGKLVTDVQPGSPPAKALEDHSLDYLHKLSEAAQSMVDVRKAEVGIEVDSANAAAARTDASDVRQRIDRKVWWAYGIAGAVLAVIAIVELVITKLIDGQIIGALILAFGALGGAIITMVNYGYGSSGSSGAKDVLIGEMARRQSTGGSQ